MFKTQYRSVDSLNSSPTTSVVAFSASAAAADTSAGQGGVRITWRWALAYVALVWLGAVLFSHLQQFCAAIYFFQVAIQPGTLQPETLFFAFFLSPLLASFRHTRDALRDHTHWLAVLGAVGHFAAFSSDAYFRVCSLAVGFAAVLLFHYLAWTAVATHVRERAAHAFVTGLVLHLIMRFAHYSADPFATSRGWALAGVILAPVAALALWIERRPATVARLVRVARACVSVCCVRCRGHADADDGTGSGEHDDREESAGTFATERRSRGSAGLSGLAPPTEATGLNSNAPFLYFTSPDVRGASLGGTENGVSARGEENRHSELSRSASGDSIDDDDEEFYEDELADDFMSDSASSSMRGGASGGLASSAIAGGGLLTGASSSMLLPGAANSASSAASAAHLKAWSLIACARIGVALGALLFVTHAMLTTSSIIPRWANLPPFPYGLAVIAALCMGIAFSRSRVALGPVAALLLCGGAVGLCLLADAHPHWAMFCGCLFALAAPAAWHTLIADLPARYPPPIVFLAALVWYWMLYHALMATQYPSDMLGAQLLGQATLILLLGVGTAALAFGRRLLSAPEVHFRLPVLPVLVALFVLAIVGLLPPTLRRAQGQTPQTSSSFIPLNPPIGIVLLPGDQATSGGARVDVDADAPLEMDANANMHATAGSTSVSAGAAADVPAYRALIALQYNIQQGFSTFGAVNASALASLLRDLRPTLIALENCDTVRMWSTNTDLIEYISWELGMHEAPGVSPRLSSTGAALLTAWQIVSTTARLLPAGANAAGSAQPSDRASMVEAVLSPPTPPAPKPTAPPPTLPPTPNASFADASTLTAAAPDVHMRAIAVRFGAAAADRTAQAAFLAQRIGALDAAESVMVFADLAGAPTDPALAPVFNALADVMSSFTNGTYVPTTDDGTTSDYIFFRKFLVDYVSVAYNAFYFRHKPLESILRLCTALC